ncbi:hypothetical protein [Empedobacter sp. UBA7248]|uniref:hypothetical protein n=1 Tax=Empedobacter sp. UBA7248 TaxID=1946448 RepID=UPI0025C4DA0F|nr:hypothetical protein [Empedobacter sp. UBA7248]
MKRHLTKTYEEIPLQKGGGFHDTENLRYIDSDGLIDDCYQILRCRFLSINLWKYYCNDFSADFRLYDKEGFHVDRVPLVGDYIRIDIPVPGTFGAKGYDWVKIISICEHQSIDNLKSSLSFICTPSVSPFRKKNKMIVHFYNEKATSTFRISKNNNSIKVGIYGRNEHPNLN